MSEFDYKKWLREQKDSLEPEEDGFEEFEAVEDDDFEEYLSDLESRLADLMKTTFKSKGFFNVIDKPAMVKVIKDFKNAPWYKEEIEGNFYDGLDRLLKHFIKIYFLTYELPTGLDPDLELEDYAIDLVNIFDLPTKEKMVSYLDSIINNYNNGQRYDKKDGIIISK